VVCTANFAGVERYVSYTAPALAKHGWDVTVIGGDRARMEAALGDVAHVPAASTGAALAALLRFDRSVIVHAHMTAAETAAVAARVARRFPLVVTRHFAARRGSSRFGRLAAPLIRSAVSQQISISDYVAAAIGEPSVTIRSGVPDDDSSPTGTSRTILMVQRLEQEKRTEDAVRAWAASTLPAAGWRLVVAGEGGEHARLTALAGDFGVRESVDFLGARDDVDALMRGASLLVATTPIEAFGLSVVEAMAKGLPVIGARGGAHLETIGSVSTRWLYEPGDHAQLSSMLEALATDPAERVRYGEALRAHQRRELSLGAHVARLEAAYDNVRV
jgi:glycosyltransferase involved in cell wall biosynthesis